MNTPRIKRILLFSLLACVLAVGGGYFAYHAYTAARQVRLVRQARNYLAKPNARKAMLCLQRALRYNPKDVEACRLMAQLYERARSPAALVLRSRIVELKPNSLDDRLALAQTAMAFRDYPSATNALQGVSAAGKKTAAYQNVAGTVASAVGQLTEAEAHFAEAARLDPTNPVPRLNLAVVRLHGTNDTSLSEARASLRRIASNPSDWLLRCGALRELLVDAMRFKQVDSALAISKELVHETNSAFSDRLLRLDVLRATTNAEFQAALAEFRHEAADDPAKVYDLGNWQMLRLSPAQALAWLQTVPAKIQTNQPVTLQIAECKSLAKDWVGLQKWLENQNWSELEFLRHGLLSRAFRGQDMDSTAKGEWELALKTSGDQKASTIMLFRLAAQWNWQSEGEGLLWTIVNRYPGEKWAFQVLMNSLYLGGRTRSLMMLCGQESKRAPSDLDLKNNLAATALLLDAQEMNPNQLAREVYQKAPTNVSFASTYAFSLYLQTNYQAALNVMDKLSPKDLEKPSIAGYYGLMLKAAGNNQKAVAFFNYAFKGPLLPEEKKLFEKGRAGA